MNETLLPERNFRPMTAPKTGSSISRATSVEERSSPESFDEQFLAYWAPVYRLLVRLVGDPAEAEDLTLETFLRLYRRPPAPGDGFNLGGWLNRVATNLGLHSIRSFRRRERYEISAGKGALEMAAEDAPAEILAVKEDHRLARLALAQMNERQSALLVMRYSGLAYKDIAAELGVSPTSIGPLLFRAEREFEKRYRKLIGEEP
ncbi:MAG TPA: sigma-70 family RNA polymerase sigma factor [Anaerolineaceae bacterium]|jgi:RNA polymerase sigma factor (sigma-70 family)